jgi:plasmid stabilization system protein ParE
LSRLPYSFHYLAERELNDAAAYYERERVGLGIAFLEELERCVESVLDHPEAAPLIGKRVRRKLLSQFPYGLIYSIRDDHVRILAVMNLKRRPFYWRSRQ